MQQTTSHEPLLEAIRRSGLLRPGDRVMVAVSGGPDSTSLLVALSELGLDITAAHFDHALREGSEGVAEHVARRCDRLGVRLVSERRASALPRGSVQAGARAVRYAFFERARAGASADVVALAHTADDVVEGAVLHLMRGCGIAGLRGMPSRRGAFVRPMLEIWRADVTEFLARRGIDAYSDPANSDLKFSRARVRHHILPDLERDRPGITRRFHAAAGRAAALQKEMERRAAALVDLDLTAVEIARLPEPLAAELIRRLYADAGGEEPGLSRSHIKSMLRLALGAEGGRGVDLPRGLRFRIVGHHMQVVAPVTARAARLEVKSCSGCGDPDAAHLRTELSLRLGYRRPGLRMRPAGGRGSRKLQDIMVDARLPREDRDTWPLVFAGERLAWVPGIAVDEELTSAPGQPALHVAISPMPVRYQSKVGRLETPKSPPGDSS